jgi:hypothetical protein
MNLRVSISPAPALVALAPSRMDGIMAILFTLLAHRSVVPACNDALECHIRISSHHLAAIYTAYSISKEPAGYK